MARPNKPHLVDRDLGWREILKRSQQMRGSYVKVGLLADDRAGQRHPGADLTIAELGAVHEYGNDHLPSRPFLRMTFDRVRDEMAHLSGRMADAVLRGKTDIPKALGVMGAKFAAEIKKTLTVGEGVPPPLKPSTIRQRTQGPHEGELRRSIKPLVDTGRLLGAITWAAIVGGRKE